MRSLIFVVVAVLSMGCFGFQTRSPKSFAQPKSPLSRLFSKSSHSTSAATSTSTPISTSSSLSTTSTATTTSHHRSLHLPPLSESGMTEALRGKNVVIEFATKSSQTSSSSTETQCNPVTLVALNSVYKERKEDVVDKVMDSPLSAIFTILFNPVTMVLALYFWSMAWSKVSWLQKFLFIFGKGELGGKKKNNGAIGSSSSSSSTAVSDVEDTPYQIFECEKCRMELRPAKGRAQFIFGRDRFRCSRCGSKASAYFDINDMSDPRAVARLERIEREKEEEELRGSDEDQDNEEEDEDEDDDDDEEEEITNRLSPSRRR